jgi:hypothetical protein
MYIGGSPVAGTNQTISNSWALWVDDGNVRFDGTVDVGTFASASGTDVCVNGSTLSSCSSSLKYKENVKGLTLGLNAVNKLRPVTFDWKDGGETDLGFVAEEVEKIDPILATYKDGKLEGVKYRQLTAVLVNAIQEQQELIKGLRVDVNAINGTDTTSITDLTVRVDGIEARVKKLESTQDLANLESLTLTGTTTIEKAIVSGLLKVNGNATFSGKVFLQNEDTTGEAVIKAGEKKIAITFQAAYPSAPVVNITPKDFLEGSFKVANITAEGFDIVLQQEQTTDISFSLLAFGKN